MQKRAIKTRNETHKKYSLRGQHKYRVPITFLVTVRIKLKIQTRHSFILTNRHQKRHWYPIFAVSFFAFFIILYFTYLFCCILRN